MGTVALATTVPANAVAENAIIMPWRKYMGGSVAVGAIGTLLVNGILKANEDSPATGVTLEKIQDVFPGAITNKSLVNKVMAALQKYKYSKSNTLVATSLGTDEVNRCLETEFSKAYGNFYNMGGLAGFPFGGTASFEHFVTHIPDGGSCLIVFGPHVGVNGDGNVGTVERPGLVNGVPCCDAAIVAAEYAIAVHKGDVKATKSTSERDVLDVQQGFVKDLLVPFGERLDRSPEIMVELPYVLYDAQKEMITDIVKCNARSVKDGKIAVLGGIQINTSPGIADYYLPLSLELYDNTGNKVDDLML